MRFLSILPLLVSLFLINKINLDKPAINISKQISSINFDQNYLKVFNFGFASMLSSWLWVKTLLESDIEPYGKKDLNSWMYLRFSSIITLDPKFYEAYLFGGKYLSIIKDDLRGAEIIFNKGLIQYPDDFWLNINAGHNYLFEIGDPEKALSIYKKIQFGPMALKYFPILPSIVSKLEKNRGDSVSAFNLLQIAHGHQTNEKFKKYFEEKLYSFKAEMDLNCLNFGKLNCNRLDYKGNPYIEVEKGIFKAKDPWKTFQLSQKTLDKIKNKTAN